MDRTTPIETQNRKFRVLSAGSLIGVKGFSLTIKAFKDFADRHPESELTIIGSGPEEKRLRALIRELKLDNNVHMIPQMPRNGLLGSMRCHDVFLFPSLRDGGGTVVIEAMAAGKPVVCLDIGGPAMHVTNDTGIKITATSPEQSVREMAAALERLYLDPKFRHELGKAARERAVLIYHWDRAGDRLADIYQHALNAQSRD